MDSASLPAKTGGDAVGENPTDRGTTPAGYPGTKRQLVVGRGGVPLAAGLTGANRPDSTDFAALLGAVEPVKRSRGRPRRRPATLHADKGYDVRHCRASLRRREIADRIARKGVEDKTRLGRHRWVVERTLAWLTRYRRLAIRYERRADIHQALLDLACAHICLNFLRRPDGFC